MSAPLGRDYRRLWSASVVSNLGDGVGMVAFPWLASAVTRDPFQIALIAVAVRLPWLLFSLPAGVVTDRVDRRKLVAWMDVLRFGVTAGVGLVVLLGSGLLPDPEALTAGTASTPDPAWPFLVALYAGGLLLGLAEVFRDNAAQTLMPAMVERDQLERANGRLWGAEVVMNSFVGPPLGGLLIAIALAVPFGVNAATFAVSAVIVWTLRGDFRPIGEPAGRRPSWRSELAEGVRWLWNHRLLRTMAIVLGVMNAVFSAALAVYVLFVQEILELSAAAFGALLTAGALGGVVGSLVAARVSRRIGPGASLYTSLLGGGLALAVTGSTSSAVVVWAAFAAFSFLAVLWNVITVSLRQAIIPDRLLGRVNSVYRFLAWGMMPVGSLLGGVIVTATESVASRHLALRMPFLLAAAAHVALFAVALPRLSTRRIEEARAAAV